jgi:ribose transport system permease protein
VREISAADVAQRIALPVAWGLVCIVFTILRPETFPEIDNFAGIFGTNAVVAILSLGLLIPLTAGDYDLSAAATLTLCAMSLALLNVNYGWSIGWAILVTIAVGVAVGLVNGGIVVVFGIDPFIVTLGTGTFVTGVVFWISNSETIFGVSESLVDGVSGSTFLDIPLSFYYALALCALLWYVFEYTPIGRRMLFVGRGRNVARLSGISVDRVRWGALVVSGLFAALAGIVYVGTLGGSNPTAGDTFLLPAFAAAFLGATSILPGRFNPWGTLIAVYFLSTGITGLQLMGVQSFVQQLFYGGALVLAVVFSQLARRREAQGLTGA